MDFAKSDDDLRVQRLKESPNMFDREEDLIVEDQDGSDWYDSSEKGDDTPARTRLKVVIARSVAFIGPTLMVAFKPSLKKHLVTVSCCVFTFAATLTASNSSMNLIELYKATTGFAAVLMVFAKGFN